VTIAERNPLTRQAGSQTVADYLALSDTRGWELDNGRLLEKNVGTKSGWIGGELYFLISLFLKNHRLGWVFTSEAAYKCFPDHSDHFRKPDVSFIRYGRLAGEELPEPFITIPPDLAAEVISPNDTAYDVERKVAEYLEAGVKLVWVVNPDLRTVRIHRADGSIGLADERGQVSGEDVLPGFTFAVADLFPKTVTVP